MLPADFKTAIPVTERPQTHALDLVSTEIDLPKYIVVKENIDL
jgi:hypothetical protein